jgi:hypothetical protein
MNITITTGAFPNTFLIASTTVIVATHGEPFTPIDFSVARLAITEQIVIVGRMVQLTISGGEGVNKSHRLTTVRTEGPD